MKNALAVTLLLAGAAVAAADAPRGSISGRIYYEDTLRPVMTSFVRFVTAEGLDLGVAGTDREGRFRLEDVPAGFHRFQAWRGAEASPFLGEIAVRPGEHVANVGFVLEPRALVRLRLETPSGREPEVERCVMESPPEIVEGVRTSSGSYEFRGRPGTWRLHVHVRGFRTHVESLELVDFDRHFATIELSTGISVVGKVLDEEGRPISGAVVDRLRVAEPPAEGASWTTDAAGRFDLAGAIPVRTRFRVCAIGYETATVGLDLTRAGFIERHDFVLRRLPVAGDIAGRVVDGRGLPLPGITVIAQPPRVPVRAETRTDDEGVFRFADWPEGIVFLKTTEEDPDRRVDAVEARPGGKPVTLVARRRAEIVVRPRFPDGSTPALWRVRVEDDPRGSVTGRGESATLIRDGDETVTLHVDVPGHPSPVPIRVATRWREAHAVDVPVDPRRLAATLAAWVLTRDDLPLEVPHFVRIEGPADVTFDGRDDAMGSLVLRRLAAGRYRVRVLRPGHEDDTGVPAEEAVLEKGRGKRVVLRADPALVVVADEGDAASPGPLRVGDAIIWAAGTRLETRGTLDELLGFFKDGEIKVEFLRDGTAVSLRFPASALTRYRLVESLR